MASETASGTAPGTVPGTAADAVPDAVPGPGALQVNCSFCAKPSSAVEKIIAGPGVYICNECVQLCGDILAEQRQASSPARTEVPVWEETMADQEMLALLPRIAAVSAQTDASLQRLVTVLRGRGVTWARIGAALQIRRQSAWERFSGEE
jgi:ATP-dependent Clp protease ATP-binding subunit ClpX